MVDRRRPLRRLLDRRVEIAELLKYYNEKIEERRIALIMLDAAIDDIERCAE